MIKELKKFRSVFVIIGIVGSIFLPKVSYAYPVFAQNAYQNPREATGRIVCANCHLAQKPVEIEVPQAVLPDTVFEAPFFFFFFSPFTSGSSGKLCPG